VRALADSSAPLPAIAIGGHRGVQDVFVGDRMRRVDVVATPRLFPGTVAGTPAIVVPARAVGQLPGVAFDYVWATGPPAQVERALARSDLAPTYVSRATGLSRSADVTTITRTYGLLRIVALAFASIALVALLLYLSARARTQLVTSAFMERMGLPNRLQAASVALEAAVLVAFAAVVGLAAAVATSGVIVEHVDPLPEYDPSAAAVIPWGELVGAGAAIVAAAALAALLVTLAVRRDKVGEALRVA
jgi:predicted lysophospholipase L1 biosynthesis ABC-type transport system permease subunit